MVKPRSGRPERLRAEPARPVRALASWLKSHYVARAGNWRARQIRRTQGRRPPTMEAALAAIAARWPDNSTVGLAHDPVFVFSAGWRSGSTWVQRALMSSGSIVIWGEPYSRADSVRSLAAQLRGFAEDWPRDDSMVSEIEPTRLAGRWVGDAYPPFALLREAHRTFLATLFAAPGRARGIDRWGLKEVRLGIDEARYLKWLFPRSRFVFLVRNPYDAWESYRTDGAWHFRWPDELVATPAHFGRLWSGLVRGFVEGHQSVGGAFVRYEDLRSDPSQWQKLGEYLDLDLSRATHMDTIRGLTAPKRPTPRAELRLLERAVAPVATGLGYFPEARKDD